MSGAAVFRPFFTAAQMAQWREVVARGFQTDLTIQRQSTVDSVYGDGETTVWSTVATTKGWFRSVPTPVRSEDSGQIITVNTYRLLLPVGTDIDVGDVVIAEGNTFIVSDTTFESTWKPYLQCSLRRRE